jgi:hypothetical protein
MERFCAYCEVVTEFLYTFEQFSCLKYKNYLLFAYDWKD